jgi:hypothetical protein
VIKIDIFQNGSIILFGETPKESTVINSEFSKSFEIDSEAVIKKDNGIVKNIISGKESVYRYKNSDIVIFSIAVTLDITKSKIILAIINNIEKSVQNDEKKLFIKYLLSI